MNLKMAEGKAVLDRPTTAWVNRLRVGALVYLLKEQEFAMIEMPFFREDSYSTGLVCISRYRDNCFKGFEKWYVSDDGCGIDGKPLMAPVQGYLPNNFVPYINSFLDEEDKDEIIRQLDERVTNLERLVMPISNRERMVAEFLGSPEECGGC